MHPEVELHTVDELFGNGVFVVNEFSAVFELCKSIIDQIKQFILLIALPILLKLLQ